MLLSLCMPLVGNAAPSASDNVKRYTVLVLDVSGSMAGQPIEALRTAATRFCEQLVQKADGSNQVAIVTYDSTARAVCEFTDDLQRLTDICGSLDDSSSTNMDEGLLCADALLSAIPDGADAIKNIILMSDGMPNTGNTNENGHYGPGDYGYYQYANAAYDTADLIKSEGCYIYTLGFFHSLDNTDMTFAARLLNDLQSSGYYEVTDPNDLEFTFGDIASDIVKPDITGELSYAPSPGAPVVSDDGMTSTSYLYYDEMFSHPALTYDQDLAIMSLELSMAAFGMTRMTDKNGQNIYANDDEQAANVVELLGNAPDTDDPGLGFEDVRAVNYQPDPGIDTIAATFGHKKISCNGTEYELILIAVRGGQYQKEWAGNFRIGSGDIHEGFEIAKNQVIEYFASYVKDLSLQDKTNVKLWITGYSRGAATANLVAAELDNHTQNQTFAIGESSNPYIGSSALKAPLSTSWRIGKDDIYAYCFATPNNSKKAINGEKMQSNAKIAEYPNIFNILNPNDIVTRVAPYEWGYDKYGYSLWLPADGDADNGYGYKSTLEPNMTAELSKLSGGIEYLIAKFRVHQGNTGFALEKNPVALYDIGPHPTNNLPLNKYIDTRISVMFFKDLIPGLKAQYYTGGGAAVHILGYVDDIQDKAISAIAANYNDPIPTLVSVIMGFRATVIDRIVLSGDNNDCAVTLQTADGVNIKTNPDEKALKKLGMTPKESQDEVAVNGEALQQAHFPELYLAWMRSLPEGYFGGIPSRSQVNYRVIHINCPVDVEVYDESGSLLGTINDNAPSNLSNAGVMFTFDDDGQKTVYLPADQNYAVKIAATDAGTMTYSVGEFCRDAGGNTRLVNYYDIPLKKGSTFDATVSAVNGDGTETSYILSGSGGIIAPDEDFSGYDVPTYTVDVNVQGKGAALGGGSRYKGEYAELTVYPDEGQKFLGWYQNGILLSDQPEYRLCVLSDTTLTARFAPGSAGFPAWTIIIILILTASLFAGIILFSTKSGHKSVAYAGPPVQRPILNNAQPSPAYARPVIKVLTGSFKGTTVPAADGETIYVGKDALSHIRFPGDYAHVSRTHCTITYNRQSNMYYVTDSSRNGTYTNGGFRLEKGRTVPIPPNTTLMLADKDCSILLE